MTGAELATAVVCGLLWYIVGDCVCLWVKVLLFSVFRKR